MLASTRSNGPRRANGCCREAGGADDLHPMSGLVETGVVAGGAHRGGIDVARQHRAVQRLRRSNGEHAGAGAEIEHAPRIMRLQHLIEQQQAAAGGAVMAGAECQRRLDLDAELVGRHQQPVVAAVHDETPGADRHQIFKARLDPVLGLDRVEGDRPRHLRPGRIADQPADPRLIGWFGEMHGDIPAPVRPLERGDRGLALEEALGEPIDQTSCGRFAADRKTRAVGAGGGNRGHHRPGCLARLASGRQPGRAGQFHSLVR